MMCSETQADNPLAKALENSSLSDAIGLGTSIYSYTGRPSARASASATKR